MRLPACILGSFAVHALLFTFSPVASKAPALSISPEPKMLDLKIRTRAENQTLAPPVKQEDTTPKHKRSEPKRKASEKPDKKKPASAKPGQAPASTPVNRPQETQRYESQEAPNPRLVENAEYLSNPPPEYPRVARRRKHEGTVTLLVDLDRQGMVSRVVLKKSSGHKTLDRAAEAAVSKWRFSPATEEAKSVSSRVIVPVEFRLTR